MRVNNIQKTLFLVFAVIVFMMAGSVSAQAQLSDSAAAAAAESRFQQLEKEIRRLTGQIEEQGYEIKRLREELAKATGDMSVRMTDIEQGRNSGTQPTISSVPYTAQQSTQAQDDIDSMDAPPPTNIIEETQSSSSFQYQAPASNNAGNETLGTLNKTEETGDFSSSDAATQAYEYAYSFVKARNFDRAEKEFAAFIAQYPDHNLVSNAKYWYGETFYVRGNYEQAARIFAEGYQQFPQGAKAPSNLLKLGMSLVGMGKQEDACIAFKQVKKDYGSASAPVLNRAEKEMEKINCH